MSKEVVKQYVVDDVEITEYSDGSSTFKAIMRPKKEEPVVEEKSWFGKMIDWFRDAPVTPYVKIRNMGDPLGKCDPEEVQGCPRAVEAGVKVRF